MAADVAPGHRGLPHGLPWHQPVDRAVFPDGLRTSGQHPPIEGQLRPYADFPHHIDGPTAWEGDDMATRSAEWTHHWTDAELSELLQAVEAFNESGTPLTAMKRDSFHIPNISSKLQTIRDEILNGRGFVLFRGLPVDEWGRQKSAVASMGISAHLGYLLSQNKLGQVLGHVTNLDADYRNSLDKVKIAATNAAQMFHTDEADIVGLLFLASGQSGGQSGCASAHTVWNALVRQRPDVAALLASPVWYFDRKGEVTAGQEPWIRAPVFYLEPGGRRRVYVKWDPYFVRSLSRFSDKGLIPPLSPEQLDAIDVLEDTCARHAFYYDCRVGDLQFVSCCQTFHSRSAFVDALPPNPPRHLLRTWVGTPEHEGGWCLPFHDSSHPKRGGIQVDSTPPTADPLVASGGTD